MRTEPDVEAALARLHASAHDTAALRAFLEEWGHDERLLLALLQRQVPARFLEFVGVTRPWCERTLVAGALARHPRTPPYLALRLLPALLWRDLAHVAAAMHLSGLVRVRAEGLLLDQLPDMRLGDKIALARLATPALLRALLKDGEGRVLEAALLNPRLSQEALCTALRGRSVRRELIVQTAESPRWRGNYGVRRELVLQPCTPLPLALGWITSLVPGDLRRVAAEAALPPLVRAAAERAAEAQAGHDPLLAAPAPRREGGGGGDG